MKYVSSRLTDSAIYGAIFFVDHNSERKKSAMYEFNVSLKNLYFWWRLIDLFQEAERN